MKKNTLAIFRTLVLIMLLGPSLVSTAQVQKKTIVTRKAIKTFDCTFCALEKKTPQCFIVQSHVGPVSLKSNKKNGIKASEESTDINNSSTITEYYYCAGDDYNEVTISASEYLSTVFSLTPYDFKTGIPIISIYDANKLPVEERATDQPVSVFEKMAELEKAETESTTTVPEVESNKPKTAEKEIFMTKEFGTTDCDYCLPTDKKARCFIIITSLKGAKLMDGTERIPHTKALKMSDSTRQYIFCFRPDKYQQFLLKAKGYQAGVVEIIPSDFANNQTPILTFLNPQEKAEKEKAPVNINRLYADKHPDRWECETCKGNSNKSACLFIYSSLPDLVLNNEKEILKPEHIRPVGSQLKQYTFCVSPTTRTLMASTPGHEPTLLKLHFDDLETMGATAFMVSDDEYGFGDIKALMEEDRTPASVPQPKSLAAKETGMEFRVQLIAKIQGDYNADKIKEEYKLSSYEVKEDYDGKWYRFTIGSYTTYNDAAKALKEFNKKNTSDAFIVLYSNGKRVGPYQP